MNTQEALWGEKKDYSSSDLVHMALAQKIIETLLEFANFTFQGVPLMPSRALLYPQHIHSIYNIISNKLPIHFILPAFPAKSPNQRKTFGHLPDYGEVLALNRLHELCAKVGLIYQFGASMTICSDGRVFSDLVEAPEHCVNEYLIGVREIIRNKRLSNLSTFCLDDALTVSPFNEMRQWLVANYGDSIQNIREHAQKDSDLRALFNGIHRFILEDQLVLHPEISKNKLRDRAKEITYSVIQRSNAWSSLLEKKYPTSVRLSIHPQTIHSKKFGIRLLQGDRNHYSSKAYEAWRTPWHSVPIYDGHTYKLVSHQEAEVQGARLTYVEEKYPCFVLKKEIQYG